MARKQTQTTQPAGTSEPDSVLAKQSDLARDALKSITKDTEVGDHLRVEATGQRLVTHFFECLKPGYKGWVWAVSLTRVPHGRICLLYTSDAADE